MATISVIVPVYNVEQYLHRCVDSILAQTFTDFELILVDDGSSDNSGAICDDYAEKDSRIKVIHKSNSGPSSARNAGIELAKGKYIYFADSDDYLESNLLLECLTRIEEDDVELFVFGAESFETDKAGSKIIFQRAKSKRIESRKERIDLVLTTILQYKIGWEPWNRIYLRDIIAQYNIRFPVNVSIAEDLFFFLCYCAHMNRYTVDDKILYHYRKTAGSLMDRQNNQITAGQKNALCKQLLGYYKSNNCKDLIKVFPAIFFRIITNMLQSYYDTQINAGTLNPRKFHAYFWQGIQDKGFYSSQVRRLPLHLKSAARTYPSKKKFAEDLSLLIFARTGFFFGFRIRNAIIRRLYKKQ